MALNLQNLRTPTSEEARKIGRKGGLASAKARKAVKTFKQEMEECLTPEERKAIVKALDMIEKDDVVLILGKGHEDYQIIGHEKIHLDDAEEVRKYLKK